MDKKNLPTVEQVATNAACHGLRGLSAADQEVLHRVAIKVAAVGASIPRFRDKHVEPAHIYAMPMVKVGRKKQ